MKMYIAIFLVLMIMSFVELFAKSSKAVRSLFSAIMFTIFLILTSIRGGIQGDYVTYKEVYTYMTDVSCLFQKGNFFYEPLYSLLQWICKRVIDEFQVFLFIIGLIVLCIEHRYAKTFAVQKPQGHKEDSREKRGCYYFTIFFVLWGLYLANIFVIRSTIALIICFYSVRYMENRKPVPFLLCAGIAVGFHYSALVFFPAYFIFQIHSKLMTKLVVFIVATVLSFLSIRWIASLAAALLGGVAEIKIKTFLSANDFMAGTGMDDGLALILLAKAVMNIAVLLILWSFLWKYNRNDRYYEGYFNLYLIGCTLYIATLAVGYAFARLSIYYNIFQIPLLMYMVKDEGNVRSNRIIYWMVLVSYIATRFVVNNLVNSVPYTVWYI